MQPQYHTVIFVGPSALGKTFAADSLLQKFPNEFSQAKLYTTRPPRNGDTVTDRIFVSNTIFDEMVNSNQFLVHGEFGGNFYGFTKEALIPDGRHILVNTWPQIIPQLAKVEPTPILAGLQAPENWRDFLTKRMQERGDSSETIKKRCVLIEKDIELTNIHKQLVNKTGKFFIIEDDQTVPMSVMPWVCKKLGLSDPAEAK